MNGEARKNFSDFLLGDEAGDVCFACHVSPDGDTVGSALALARLLRARGRRAFVYVPGVLPDTLNFLFEDFDNTPFEPKSVVAVDVSTPARLGEAFAYADRVRAVIDHHENNGFSVEYSYVCPGKSATAQLVAEVYDALGEPFDEKSATALYTALSTDTGRFCHSNSTPDVFRLAARLAAAVPGENFGALNRRLFIEKDAARLKLEGYVLSHAVLKRAEGYVFFALTQRLRARFGLIGEEHDLGALVDVLRTFRGFDTCILAKETETRGVYKLSVRTEGELSASDFCAAFGGGGHARAAGCTVQAGSVRALQKVLAERLCAMRAR